MEKLLLTFQIKKSLYKPMYKRSSCFAVLCKIACPPFANIQIFFFILSASVRKHTPCLEKCFFVSSRFLQLSQAFYQLNVLSFCKLLLSLLVSSLRTFGHLLFAVVHISWVTQRGNLITTSANAPSLFCFVFLFLVLVDVFNDFNFS